MKCKPYSEITVEIRTQSKTVKITSNIFAVYHKHLKEAVEFSILYHAATIHCGCQKIRSVFRVLDIYDFEKQFNCIYHATKVDLSLLAQLHKKLFLLE